jgi:signal transduction histidine kinase
MTRAGGRRPRSIVGPIVMLVVAAIAVASLVQYAIMFSGPPPFPPPVPIEELAAGLKQGHPPARMRAGRFTILSGTPAPDRRMGFPSEERDAAIAKALGVPATEVSGRYQRVQAPGRDALWGDFIVTWRSPSGTRSALSAPRPFLSAWHRLTLGSTLAVLGLLTLGAWLVARAISRPIRKLAAVAGSMRLGTRSPIPREGPREVRELAAALDTMQSRILKQAESRTTMLAAIAHDMGTPITRLAFWVEQLPDHARERAAADIDEIRAMLATVLRFARDQRIDTSERVDLGSLIESLIDDMAMAGASVSIEPGPRAIVRGDSQSLRRLVANLVENGVRYGGSATVGWQVEDGQAIRRRVWHGRLHGGLCQTEVAVGEPTR